MCTSSNCFYLVIQVLTDDSANKSNEQSTLSDIVSCSVCLRAYGSGLALL